MTCRKASGPASELSEHWAREIDQLASAIDFHASTQEFIPQARPPCVLDVARRVETKLAEIACTEDPSEVADLQHRATKMISQLPLAIDRGRLQERVDDAANARMREIETTGAYGEQHLISSTYVAVELLKMPPCSRTPAAPHCLVELVLDDPRYTQCLKCGLWKEYTGNEWREVADLA